MAHYPGYTVLRTEDCPEQHGTLTLLTHDVSGAAAVSYTHLTLPTKLEV